MNAPLTFSCIPFGELGLTELYELLALRQEIFVVEQDCPYQDVDGKDLESYHVLAKQANKLIAYARIVPPGISYKDYSSIGRVVTKKEMRGTGFGKELMKESIQRCKQLHPNKSIKISAQVYLLKFYTDLGFKEIGEEYLEDDIPHKAMLLE